MGLIQRIRRIASCEFAGFDLLWYLFHEAMERSGLETAGLRCYRLKNGLRVALRASSTDAKVFQEVFAERIYAPFAERLMASTRPDDMPRVLVDLGANIGLSALFLQNRLRFERVIAVEPDAGNVRMLNRNLEGQIPAVVTVRQAFAGAAHGFARISDAGLGAWGLRMGEPAEDGVPVIPLEDIVPDVPGGVLLKCDIEGGERFLFPRIRAWEDRVRFIILELHMEFFTGEQLRESLAGSCYEWEIHGEESPGAVMAVLGLERCGLKDPGGLKRDDSLNASSGDVMAMSAQLKTVDTPAPEPAAVGTLHSASLHSTPLSGLNSGSDSRSHSRGASAV